MKIRFPGFFLCLLFPCLLAASDPAHSDPSGGANPVIAPAPQTAERKEGVDWNGLILQSVNFLSVEHGFRLLTEPGTRRGMRGSFWPGYSSSIRSLHGWADGDPFYVNYVGHPMMGAVAGQIFVNNDHRYRNAEFGKSREYWKGRLRATAFSFLYSTQFELGPFSEASLGKIQRTFPQQGLVDLVITPFAGLGWMIAEDALDKYFVKRVEGWTTNSWIRLLARGGLGPTKSMANLMRGEVPWRRDTRPGIFVADSYLSGRAQPAAEVVLTEPPPGVAPFEFTLDFLPEFLPGTGATCYGGGASAAFRLSYAWQLVGEAGGCKLQGLRVDLTGDSMTYLLGPQYTFRAGRRLTTHLNLLAGGHKMTEELFYPGKWNALPEKMRTSPDIAKYRDLYVRGEETNGFAVAAGGGVDWKLNSAFSLRIADVRFRHSWIRPLDGVNYSNGIQFSTGLVLKMGTW
ncbi:MAG: hypothetical protein HY820_28660 [Acidobacteria bacterium]|nr:hypothetical protein [Acidobacteriota bacterium]